MGLAITLTAAVVLLGATLRWRQLRREEFEEARRELEDGNRRDPA